MTIDLISRFGEDTQVVGWVTIKHNNRVDLHLQGENETTNELFDALVVQLKTLGCRVSKSYKCITITHFRHLGMPKAFFKMILEEELQKAGIIILSEEQILATN